MIVQASVAVSVDGYIDDLSDRRLVLSHAADWEEVRSLRAESDRFWSAPKPFVATIRL